MAFGSILRKSARFIGQSRRPYVLTSPLGQRSETVANIWKAIDENDSGNQFVIKHPGLDGNPTESSAALQKEIEMQNLFQSSYFIRRMVDVIPPIDTGTDSTTMMVLEPFEKSLWTARTRRQFSMKEMKHIMKLALLGLNEVHEKGYVYCDFKMENVLLNGFDDKTPTSNEEKVSVNIQVKLADLGSVMPPNKGKITSITYRSPEAYLGKPWTSATDIWSWGIVFFHLIQARFNFDSPGIYDSIVKGVTLKEKENAIITAMCEDFDLQSVKYFEDCDLPPIKERSSTEESQEDPDHWGDKLLAQGVPHFDVVFLYAVLQPDPNKRMTVAQILETGYLDVYKKEE